MRDSQLLNGLRARRSWWFDTSRQRRSTLPEKTMLEFRYLSGLDRGRRGDRIDLSLVGGKLHLACPGIFGLGRWVYELPLQSIDDVRISAHKVLVIDTAGAGVSSSIRIAAAWVDLEAAYSTISRACPWLGEPEAIEAVRPPSRSRLVRTLDTLQLLLVAVLLLFVSVFMSLRWPP
jgi:hypothetical protein